MKRFAGEERRFRGFFIFEDGRRGLAVGTEAKEVSHTGRYDYDQESNYGTH
jgi:hypothetical protein